MLGKPTRGQRTWSNAWTSYNYNKLLRAFINKTYFLLNKNKRKEKIEYKKIKKLKKGREENKVAINTLLKQ